MDPLTQSLIGNRTVPPAGAFDHWQAAPLRLALSLASGESLTGAVSIVAELHASQTVAADPLASVEHILTDFDGPWELDFTGPQMNQSIAESIAKRSLWLLVVATYASGRVDPLVTRTVTLHRTNYSGTVADPPAAVTYLTTAAAEAQYVRIPSWDDLGTNEGWVWAYCGGKRFKYYPSSLENIP